MASRKTTKKATAKGKRVKAPAAPAPDPNDAVFSGICERIALGEGLRGILRDDGMPSLSTVFRWLEANEARREQYARARERQAEFFSDEILEIADDGTNDWMERETRSGDAVTVFNHEHAQRSKLRVESRKWLMAKRAPKKYGDKITTELVGKDGGPIETRSTVVDLTKATDEELAVLEGLVARSAKPGGDPGGAGT